MFFTFKLRKVRRRRRVRRKVGVAGHKQYLAHKEAARGLVMERLVYWNEIYKTRTGRVFIWSRVSIRNTRSRWGSCSSKQGLNFNYRIIFLPPHLVDYLIVHELCHLHEMNHSSRFWSLVAHVIPDHTAHRAELQKVHMSSLPVLPLSIL